jgi:hypothetical protein
VRTVAAVGGAGDSLIGAAAGAGADVYVTGDLRHHVTLDALELGLSLIDAGHHATEVAALPSWRARLDRGGDGPGAGGDGGSVVGPDRSLEVRVPDPSPEELEQLLELQTTDQPCRNACRHQLDDLPGTEAAGTSRRPPGSSRAVGRERDDPAGGPRPGERRAAAART